MSNDRPIMISACIITYNQENYIEKCINGALTQKTNFDYEIVIGDDNSTDGTSEICKMYTEKFPLKFRYFHRNQNLGMMGNWIATINNCNGKYIALCEGDDYWTDPLKLQKQVDFLERNSKFSSCFHLTPEIRGKEFSGKVFGANAPDIVYSEDTISLWSLFHTSSFVFRKSAFKYYDELSSIFSADMALFSIVSRYGPIKKIEEKMSVYRKHEGGITATNDNTVSFYDERIKLIRFLNKLHYFKYNEKAESVISELQKFKDDLISKQTSTLSSKNRKHCLRLMLRNLFRV